MMMRIFIHLCALAAAYGLYWSAENYPHERRDVTIGVSGAEIVSRGYRRFATSRLYIRSGSYRFRFYYSPLFSGVSDLKRALRPGTMVRVTVDKIEFQRLRRMAKPGDNLESLAIHQGRKQLAPFSEFQIKFWIATGIIMLALLVFSLAALGSWGVWAKPGGEGDADGEADGEELSEEEAWKRRMSRGSEPES